MGRDKPATIFQSVQGAHKACAYNATPQTTPAKDRSYVLPGLIEDASIKTVVSMQITAVAPLPSKVAQPQGLLD